MTKAWNGFQVHVIYARRYLLAYKVEVLTWSELTRPFTASYGFEVVGPHGGCVPDTESCCLPPCNIDAMYKVTTPTRLNGDDVYVMRSHDMHIVQLKLRDPLRFSYSCIQYRIMYHDKEQWQKKSSNAHHVGFSNPSSLSIDPNNSQQTLLAYLLSSPDLARFLACTLPIQFDSTQLNLNLSKKS
ncbi:hypothetical protein L1887_07241 [Cichorium endivia]|nr:hypothetical protein L1887_07241 [Cichorium endivia]